MRTFLTIILLSTSFYLLANDIRVEPPNWWAGMENPHLQLMVHADEIATYEVLMKGKNRVRVTGIHEADSDNYIFIDLDLSNALPGKIEFTFTHDSKPTITTEYEILARKIEGKELKGFDASDVIYLITPDRFSNGNPKNDIDQNLKEKTIDRTKDYARHGGDIQGIINHLDYIKSMGFTALWSSPLLINDMPQWSYHGYAMTDFYQVDPRFGTLEEYIELSEKAKNQGIKLIMDMVANHCGSEHWWMDDLPFSDWVNYADDYKVTNHRRTTNMDPYAAASEKELMSKGWFVPSMPDLNQTNPFMAAYLIQNSIWWVETLQLGGIRQDTYPYPDKDFMAQWAKAIMMEYPNFSIVGEEWSYNPLLIGYWLDGAGNKDGYRSYLTSSMDFAMQQLITDGLKEEEGWNSGLVKIYEGLANDFHYVDPKRIMIFPDNHDMDRIFTQLNEDQALTKMALALHLTLPRIPQIYYGTEILMQNTAKPGDHGLIRTDFPGGWDNDKVNGFDGKGLTTEQKSMQDFLKSLLNYRKSSETIHSGETIHYAPRDGVYVMSRYDDDKSVVVLINKKDASVNISPENYNEIFSGKKKFMNVLSGEEGTISGSINLPERSVTILELQ